MYLLPDNPFNHSTWPCAHISNGKVKDSELISNNHYLSFSFYFLGSYGLGPLTGRTSKLSSENKNSVNNS
jgi:hypothetical protein